MKVYKSMEVGKVKGVYQALPAKHMQDWVLELSVVSVKYEKGYWKTIPKIYFLRRLVYISSSEKVLLVITIVYG